MVSGIHPASMFSSLDQYLSCFVSPAVYYLQLASDWGNPPVTVETFADCVELCTYDSACQFVQFDYNKQEDNCRLKVQNTAKGR